MLSIVLIVIITAVTLVLVLAAGIKLDFLKPFEAHNTAEFILTPQGDERTDVSWSMSGPTPFMGKDFEAGLANLKTVNELAQ